MDLVIRGALLADGSGATARPADIGVVEGSIVEIGDAGSIAAIPGRTIDADGQVDVRVIYDHRVMDGATVARALGRVEHVLQTDIVAELHDLRHADAA